MKLSGEGKSENEVFQNKKKWNSFKMFLYVLPFIALVLVFHIIRYTAGYTPFLTISRPSPFPSMIL